MGCIPTLAQCNDIRLQNGQRSSTPSTYDKEIQKWNRELSISHSEYAKSISASAVKRAKMMLVLKLKTGSRFDYSAAERGTRKEGHIKPISDAVKERVQRDIKEYLEFNSRKMCTCACCDELCRPKDTYDVSLNERWTNILYKYLHWTSDIPDAIRADYDVSKVDSRSQALGNVALSPRGVLEGNF
jgi:hypothetical protein